MDPHSPIYCEVIPLKEGKVLVSTGFGSQTSDPEVIEDPIMAFQGWERDAYRRTILYSKPGITNVNPKDAELGAKLAISCTVTI